MKHINKRKQEKRDAMKRKKALKYEEDADEPQYIDLDTWLKSIYSQHYKRDLNKAGIYDEEKLLEQNEQTL